MATISTRRASYQPPVRLSGDNKFPPKRKRLQPPSQPVQPLAEQYLASEDIKMAIEYLHRLSETTNRATYGLRLQNIKSRIDDIIEKSH